MSICAPPPHPPSWHVFLLWPSSTLLYCFLSPPGGTLLYFPSLTRWHPVMLWWVPHSFPHPVPQDWSTRGGVGVCRLQTRQEAALRRHYLGQAGQLQVRSRSTATLSGSCWAVTGEEPLYGDIIWVMLGSYRWGAGSWWCVVQVLCTVLHQPGTGMLMYCQNICNALFHYCIKTAMLQVVKLSRLMAKMTGY